MTNPDAMQSVALAAFAAAEQLPPAEAPAAWEVLSSTEQRTYYIAAAAALSAAEYINRADWGRTIAGEIIP